MDSLTLQQRFEIWLGPSMAHTNIWLGAQSNIRWGAQSNIINWLGSVTAGLLQRSHLGHPFDWASQIFDRRGQVFDWTNERFDWRGRCGFDLASHLVSATVSIPASGRHYQQVNYPPLPSLARTHCYPPQLPLMYLFHYHFRPYAIICIFPLGTIIPVSSIPPAHTPSHRSALPTRPYCHQHLSHSPGPHSYQLKSQ